MTKAIEQAHISNTGVSKKLLESPGKRPRSKEGLEK